MNIIKKVTFIAKDDSIKEMKDLLKTMVEPSKNEKGCLSYEIYQLKENPAKFVVVEAWEDEEALEGHKTTEHYKYYKANFEPYCKDKYSDDLEII
ncbi:antibiotic biosynthesis monooxygenase [Arcobacter sp. KX21116]|mgnify:CR=1 FL=1|jgi:quinol monooxygenase YgiN|uniref:putative quinol monooxygenase n=1 Tax=Arcobacter iocasae TaxID=2906515 RepID=UPI0035D43924|tara:strand:- start:1036 stop:1320 length:285 start_codon:yes stop_codon:yes gene_type:complete